MPEQKYTQEGLPVVSEDTINIFIRDLERRLSEDGDSFENLFSEIEDKLGEENPNLILIKDYVANREWSEKELDLFNFGLCFAYNLLHNQLEINKMEKVYQE